MAAPQVVLDDLVRHERAKMFLKHLSRKLRHSRAQGMPMARTPVLSPRAREDHSLRGCAQHCALDVPGQHQLALNCPVNQAPVNA